MISSTFCSHDSCGLVEKNTTSHEDRKTFFFGSSLSLSLAVLEIKIAKKKKKRKLFFLPGHKLDAERILSQKKKRLCWILVLVLLLFRYVCVVAILGNSWWEGKGSSDVVLVFQHRTLCVGSVIIGISPSSSSSSSPTSTTSMHDNSTRWVCCWRWWAFSPKSLQETRGTQGMRNSKKQKQHSPFPHLKNYIGQFCH